MQRGDQHINATGSTEQEATDHRLKAQPSNHDTVFSSTPIPISSSPNHEPALVAFGINATTPPLTDPRTTMQRADEINTIQRMFGDKQTSAVMLIGSPGVGKSTLAALLYRRLQLAKQTNLPAPKYMVWLTIGTYTTLPDIIAAILNGVGMPDPGLFLLKPEQQISALLRALRRPSDNALVVLDQFELLLHPETNQGVAGRGVLPLFMDMLQTDLGASRILLTSYHSPYDEQKISEPRVRSYLVSRISLPEGVSLLQQRGVQATPEEYSFTWQHCAGHVYDLVLCSALIHMSGLTLNHLLNSPDYKPVWSSDVTANLIIAVHYFLTPTQGTILHALSLFHEPAPMTGIFMTITGETMAVQKQRGQEHLITIFEQELNLLIQYGIVQPLLSPNEMQVYTIHPLLRQYVLEHFMENTGQVDSEKRVPPWSDRSSHNTVIDNSDERQNALAAGNLQVAVYYKQVVTEQCPPVEQRTRLQDIHPIISMLRHLCLGWRWQRACDILFNERLHESMVQWGAWNTLIGLYTAMLPPFGQLLRKDEGLVASHVGMLYGRIAEYQQSKVYFEQALNIQRQIGDQSGEATTLINQGEILRVRGDHTQARQNFETALHLLEQQANNNQVLCVVYHNLGLLSHQERDYAQAYSYYTEALKLSVQLPKQPYTGMILTNLGMLLYEQRRHQEALAILFTALQMRQDLQDPTTPLLERFLVAIEQKMGSKNYMQLSKEALNLQSEVLARFIPANMRQYL